MLATYTDHKQSGESGGGHSGHSGRHGHHDDGGGKRRALRTVLLAIAIASLAVALAAFLVFEKHWRPFWPAEPPSAAAYDLAAWEWRSPDKFSAEELASYMPFAEAERIRTIYIDVSSVIDINELKDPTEKARRLQAFNDATRQFVQASRRHGITVHGLAGSVEWAQPAYRYLPLQVMDYVSTYNTAASPEERLAGLQFDIEVHNLRGFKQDKPAVLNDFLVTAEQISTRLPALRQTVPDFRLGYAIPYWYDNENGNIPAIKFAGTSKPVGFHLMDILNKQSGGYVVLMDYRDRADGKDGSIAKAEGEMTYAADSAPNVGVVIGQLTGKAKPSSTTFYDEEPQKLYEALGQIEGHFRDRPNYEGLAVHDFRDFRKLVED
jgi:hypothetical protein